MDNFGEVFGVEVNIGQVVDEILVFEYSTVHYFSVDVEMKIVEQAEEKNNYLYLDDVMSKVDLNYFNFFIILMEESVPLNESWMTLL